MLKQYLGHLEIFSDIFLAFIHSSFNFSFQLYVEFIQVMIGFF